MDRIKKLHHRMWEKVKAFCLWIWQECRDVRTLILLAVVIAVVYCPVWGGYLAYFLTKNKWFLSAATAVALFWAGPGTPFFPLCVSLALLLKKLLEKMGIMPSREKTEEVIEETEEKLREKLEEKFEGKTGPDKTGEKARGGSGVPEEPEE